MMLGVRLPEKLECRLNRLAEKTHRAKSFYVKEALTAYLDAYEEEISAIADYENQLHQGTLKTSSLEEVLQKLKLSKNDLENRSSQASL